MLLNSITIKKLFSVEKTWHVCLEIHCGSFGFYSPILCFPLANSLETNSQKGLDSIRCLFISRVTELFWLEGTSGSLVQHPAWRRASFKFFLSWRLIFPLSAWEEISWREEEGSWFVRGRWGSTVFVVSGCTCLYILFFLLCFLNFSINSKWEQLDNVLLQSIMSTVR